MFQLSIDVSKLAQFHYNLGKELAPLRERGILIIGSGNIVHNLGRMHYARDTKPFDWAVEFDELAKHFLIRGEHERLITYEDLGRAATLSIPTPDHYWPLLYSIALQENKDNLSFPVIGIAHGSVSMRAVAIGMK